MSTPSRPRGGDAGKPLRRKGAPGVRVNRRDPSRAGYQPRSFGAGNQPRQRVGEHTATGGQVDRARAERESLEDLTNEPMREGDEGSARVGSGTAPATGSDEKLAGTEEQPELLEALGDMPLGAEDDDKP